MRAVIKVRWPIMHYKTLEVEFKNEEELNKGYFDVIEELDDEQDDSSDPDILHVENISPSYFETTCFECKSIVNDEDAFHDEDIGSFCKNCFKRGKYVSN